MENMTVLYKNNSGITQVGIDSDFFNKRKVFIEGEVTSESMMDTLKKIMYLVIEDPEEPIDIYINSPGGEVSAGLMLYDFLQSIEDTPIRMYCVCLAASMGAVLFAGGQKGRRYILPHAKVMIHEPLISGGFGGSASSINKTAESINETKKTINNILAKHTGKTLKQINKATSYDNYMNAEEAVEFGIADEIVKKIF